MSKIMMILALCAAPALAGAQSVTVSGANGASYQSTRDCTRAAGSANCTKSSTLTGAAGESVSREKLRVREGKTAQTTVTGTGPNGETKTRQRLITVTN